ncbi:putative peptidylprolyl isomerase [Lupinus albus]|uniref:peptidylprolyl isomerase n=1 Tax=Lupinus albus TaxID=3870 RepID=A0A6A4R4A1_LUPAL|nr:putative peptidylprolyl isomerase [Lupinus albus]
MAFWGVEVKPGKPFSHKYDDLKGRLHISMATLGFGSSTSKSILQCNIGNRSPIYLCSLYPGNTESLQLNLELEEEADEVIFSVIGPRSIHICGYYLSSSSSNPTNHLSEDESFGEDIANTESDNSADDDHYDDSFIDDEDHPHVFPSSPLSHQEETSIDDNKPKRKKTGLRRLRKYQSVESDADDNCSEEKNTTHNDETKEIIDDDHDDDHDDDSLPISSLYKNKASERVLHQEMDDDRAAGDTTHKNAEDGANNIIETTLKTDDVIVHSQTHREVEVLDPCTVLDVGSIKKEKKKKKGKTKETKNFCNDHSIKPDSDVQEEPKMDKMTHDLLAGNEQYQEHADNKETETSDKMVASSEVRHEQGEKPKRKRKERSKEEGIIPIVIGSDHSNIVNDASPSAETPEKRKKRKKKEHVKEDSHLEGDIAHHEDIVNKHKSRRDAAEFDNVIHNFPEGKEQHLKVIKENVVDIGAHDLPDGNQSEDRKVKKKKKKSKSRGDEEVAKSFEQSSDMVKEDGNKRADAKPSNVKTLSNGVVIEELGMGIKDGKIAESGKRISVHYTGMLKENGVVFESNAGQAPFKFRLGKGEVCEGWDVGLEGMRVGEKRRLVIPPSMMSKSEGQSATIPPNSWLVYELELVKVH